MQGIEFAGLYAVAETEAAEFTSLHVSQCVATDAGCYALIYRKAGFIVGMSVTVHDWFLDGP